MENTVMRDPKLQIPHPGIHERAFVLKPLCQIAPDMIHPLEKKSIRSLWEDIPEGDRSMVRIGKL
jgi:2-amino-4-hydroxy-6-hydroxymethyldihydropteridine diphosphokinase